MFSSIDCGLFSFLNHLFTTFLALGIQQMALNYLQENIFEKHYLYFSMI